MWKEHRVVITKYKRGIQGLFEDLTKAFSNVADVSIDEVPCNSGGLITVDFSVKEGDDKQANRVKVLEFTEKIRKEVDKIHSVKSKQSVA
jgi:hypothetical protein